MQLFEVDENDQVKLNKAWIHLVPELAVILSRDKGSPGDRRGERKIQARKEFTLIYFFCDFHSPIRDWDEEHRWAEALKYAELESANVKKDTVLKAAIDAYTRLIIEGARAFRSYRSIYKAISAMDTYFETLDFKELDKKGEMKNSPQVVAASIVKMGALYDEADSFARRIEKQLSENETIRGKSELGDNEGKIKTWDDSQIKTKSAISQQSGTKSFTDLMKDIQDSVKGSKQEIPDTAIEI